MQVSYLISCRPIQINYSDLSTNWHYYNATLRNVGLHVVYFWTPHFSVWTPHFGWDTRLNYTMVLSERGSVISLEKVLF